MMCRVRVVLPEDSGPKIYLDDAPARDAANAQGQIKADGTRGNDGNVDVSLVRELHYRALAVLALNGRKRGSQSFGAGVQGIWGRFFGHDGTPYG